MGRSHSIGPGRSAAETVPTVSAIAHNQAYHRHLADGSRPFGYSSSKNTNNPMPGT